MPAYTTGLLDLTQELLALITGQLPRRDRLEETHTALRSCTARPPGKAGSGPPCTPRSAYEVSTTIKDAVNAFMPLGLLDQQNLTWRVAIKHIGAWGVINLYCVPGFCTSHDQLSECHMMMNHSAQAGLIKWLLQRAPGASIQRLGSRIALAL